MTAATTSTGTRKVAEAPLPAGYIHPEGMSTPLASHYDLMGMGSRGGPAKLFVGGISAHTTTEALRGHFSKYGRIIDAVVMQKNGRPRGFGFVTFDSALPAELALADAQWLDGRLVDVKQAVPGERAQERASNKIFVGGLPQDVSTDELRAYFSSYGAVADAVVMVDRRTNRSRGFGFVRFGNGAQGNAASEAVLMDFGCHRLAGKWVEVKRATPASQLQDMFPGQEFDEELCGMTAEEAMMAASMGMPIHDYMGLMGWDISPSCSDSTPMGCNILTGMEETCGRSNTRARRPRRRQQRSQKLDGCSEDASDDGPSTTSSYCIDSRTGEVAFLCTSSSGTPTATANVEVGFEARPLGSVLQEQAAPSQRQLRGGAQEWRPQEWSQKSGGQLKATSGGHKSGAVPRTNASENDPSRANATRGHSTAASDSPMKVMARREVGLTREEGQGDDFSRDDFLSLEVGRTWGQAF